MEKNKFLVIEVKPNFSELIKDKRLIRLTSILQKFGLFFAGSELFGIFCLFLQNKKWEENLLISI